MSARKIKRSTLSVLRIAAVAVCLSLSVFAQTPSPTPSPAPAGSAGSSLPQFFDNLIGRAGALIPMLQNEIEGPLSPWLENLSWWLAVLVIIFGFARLWRENAGAGADDSSNPNIGVEVLILFAVSPIRNGFRAAFQMNRETVAANARIKRLVHKVRLKA